MSKKGLFIIAFVLLSLILFDLCAVCDSILVSKTQGDYSSIQKAIDSAEPGDTISLAKGTYEENLIIDKDLILKEAKGSNVEIKGASEGYPLIRVGSSPVKVTLKGLTLKGAKKHLCKDVERGICPSGISINGRARVELNNIASRNNGRYGLWIGGSSRVIMENCEINRNGRHGLWLGGSAEAELKDNKINDNNHGLTIVQSASVKVEKTYINTNDLGVSIFGPATRGIWP